MIADILIAVLLFVLYLLIGAVIWGSAFGLTALGTALLVTVPTLPLLRLMPTVRQPFFDATESLTGTSLTGPKNAAFLTVYVGTIALYCVVYLAVFAVSASAITYEWYAIFIQNALAVVGVAGVLSAGLLAVATSGRLRDFESPTQLIFEWAVFVTYLTTICTVVGLGVLWVVLVFLATVL